MEESLAAFTSSEEEDTFRSSASVSSSSSSPSESPSSSSSPSLKAAFRKEKSRGGKGLWIENERKEEVAEIWGGLFCEDGWWVGECRGLLVVLEGVKEVGWGGGR